MTDRISYGLAGVILGFVLAIAVATAFGNRIYEPPKRPWDNPTCPQCGQQIEQRKTVRSI